MPTIDTTIPSRVNVDSSELQTSNLLTFDSDYWNVQNEKIVDNFVDLATQLSYSHMNLMLLSNQPLFAFVDFKRATTADAKNEKARLSANIIKWKTEVYNDVNVINSKLSDTADMISSDILYKAFTNEEESLQTRLSVIDYIITYVDRFKESIQKATGEINYYKDSLQNSLAVMNSLDEQIQTMLGSDTDKDSLIHLNTELSQYDAELKRSIEETSNFVQNMAIHLAIGIAEEGLAIGVSAIAPEMAPFVGKTFNMLGEDATKKIKGYLTKGATVVSRKLTRQASSEIEKAVKQKSFDFDQVLAKRKGVLFEIAAISNDAVGVQLLASSLRECQNGLVHMITLLEYANDLVENEKSDLIDIKSFLNIKNEKQAMRSFNLFNKRWANIKIVGKQLYKNNLLTFKANP